MITIDMEEVRSVGIWGGLKRRVAYRGSMVAPELKSGKRNFKLCALDTDKFFGIPADATDLRLVLTKTAHPEAYKLSLGTSTWGGQENKADNFALPGLYSGASMCLKKAVAKGYKYVRFDYRTAA